MTLEEMRTALSEANRVLNVADRLADELADMLMDRLDHVSPYRRVRLKRRLRAYHGRTGEKL